MNFLVTAFIRVAKIPRRFAAFESKGYVINKNIENNNKKARTMTTSATAIFKGNKDRYDGITVDSTAEPCETTAFPDLLKASLDHWLEEKKRAIWFRVSLEQTDWVPILAKNGFKFHHAKEEYVTMYRWLPTHQICNIPPYAHTNLGVGAFVLNEQTEEILVVQERYSVGGAMWKLPGGYLEPGENIGDAAQREVLEETGIQAEFKCLIAFRHAHEFAFNCSDIYMVVCLTPRNFDIKKCEREISKCTWMKLQEYADHQEVHNNNRYIAKKLIECRKQKTGMAVDITVHPVFKKPICVYSIEKSCS